MQENYRSGCPVATTLDIIGDKWSLLLVRDMLMMRKTTFKEFSTSPEGIAPGILSSRLKWLEENQLISKQKLPHNQKENIYLLSEKGIELAPVITEIILWSDKNLRKQNAEMYSIAEAGYHQNKEAVTEGIQNKYREMVKSLLN